MNSNYIISIEEDGNVAHVRYVGEPPVATFYRRDGLDPKQLAEDFLDAKTLRGRLFRAEQAHEDVSRLGRLMETEPESLPGKKIVDVAIAVFKRLKGMS